MASGTSIHSLTYVSDQTMANTTFVQADPSNFKVVVQKLTGAPEPEPERVKLPLAAKTHKTDTRKPSFERRRAAKKLELSIGVSLSERGKFFNGGSETVMASPVSPLEVVGARRSPQEEEEEERAIAEKGFYLHPTPRASDPPQLLTLFPLH